MHGVVFAFLSPAPEGASLAVPRHRQIEQSPECPAADPRRRHQPQVVQPREDGGLVGAGLLALGIARLPASPRQAAAWMPMLVTGAVAGSLLALDNALGLDRTSVLFPVWQAAVGVRLAMALRR